MVQTFERTGPPTSNGPKFQGPSDTRGKSGQPNELTEQKVREQCGLL